MCRTDLTQEYLKTILHYDSNTGVFAWKFPVSTKIRPGMLAGSINPSDGYVYVGIKRKQYAAHRLAILYMEGYLSEFRVDHINKIRTDNRYANLRQVSQQCNMRNARMSSNNISGVKGVRFDGRKWRAHVCVGQTYQLGYFTDKLEAAYHRYAAEQCLGYPDCDTNSSAKQFIDQYRLGHRTE